MNDASSKADSQQTRIVHEGPSINIPADKITFVPTGIKTDEGELFVGPAYGDIQNGRHGTFVRMPAGFVSPVHIHTEDYYAVVVEGVMANHAPDSEAVPLPVGSYYFQQGEEAHITRCLSETDCLFFIVQPGKFDVAPPK